jgi:hypothetical protein
MLDMHRVLNAVTSNNPNKGTWELCGKNQHARRMNATHSTRHVRSGSGIGPYIRTTTNTHESRSNSLASPSRLAPASGGAAVVRRSRRCLCKLASKLCRGITGSPPESTPPLLAASASQGRTLSHAATTCAGARAAPSTDPARTIAPAQ